MSRGRHTHGTGPSTPAAPRAVCLPRAVKLFAERGTLNLSMSELRSLGIAPDEAQRIAAADLPVLPPD